MIKLLKSHVSFYLLLISLCGCAGMEVPDFQGNITLPASGDCWGMTVLSKKETRLPKAECEELKKRAIFLDSDNWKILRKSVQRNCQHLKCKQIVGALDDLFLVLDEAASSIPVP